MSSIFAWGIYGLSLLRYWERISGVAAYSLATIHTESLSGLDELARRALAPALFASGQVRDYVAAQGENCILNGTILHSLGNRFSGSALPRAGGRRGRATCAVAVFEDTFLPNAAEICGSVDLVIAASAWGEQMLRANGATNVATCLQGIEPSVFHPAPRYGALEGRFAVFSGGKMEHRKAHDLVLLAFRAFAQRHPEAVLVTCWQSHWPQIAMTLNRNQALAPLSCGTEGVDVIGWAVANGIDRRQIIDLAGTPNHLMGNVLREMDVAVFPNRCEGGTNQVAMECMACGIPVIVSNNTGHAELIATGAPYILTRQAHVSLPDCGTEGWGESDPEEIVAALEHAWCDRAQAQRRGQQGAEAMQDWTWLKQLQRMHSALPS